MAAVPGCSVNTDYYARQLRLPELGLKGQQRLAASRVLVVGAGALGHPAALVLTLAGVGHLTLMDRDSIELSNLHRQPLFTPADVGRSKVECVVARLQRQRPDLSIRGVEEWFSANALQRALVAEHDLVMDACDRFSSKYLLHDTCYRMQRPLVSAAVSGFVGQLHLFPFDRRRDICLRCLYAEAPADGCSGSCAEDGVLGAATQIMGNWEAMAALRMLLGLPAPEPFCTHQWDLARGTVERFAWEARSGCWHEAASMQTEAATCTTQAYRGADEATLRAALPAEALLSQPEAASVAHYSSDTTIIDLRPPYEGMPIDHALFPNTLTLPFAQLKLRATSLDPAAHYLLICEHGINSALAREYLRAAGFKHVIDLEGGMRGLRARLRA